VVLVVNGYVTRHEKLAWVRGDRRAEGNLDPGSQTPKGLAVCDGVANLDWKGNVLENIRLAALQSPHAVSDAAV
jgi:hypothetical protein